MGVRVRAAELFRVRLPLVEPFRTAHGATARKDALLVRVDTDTGSGWGECVAQAEPDYLPDTIDTSRLALRDHLLPRLFAGAPLDDVRGHAPARAALECALLDAQLRERGVSLAAHLGATRDRVEAGVAIGLSDEAELARLVEHYVTQGYRRIKCKIEPGRAEAIARRARVVAGPGVTIAVDANESYCLADADCLRALDEYDLQCIEQPLPRDALADSAALASRLRTRIGLDESITSPAIARDAIVRGAGAIVSVKPGRLGGLGPAGAVLDVCVDAGVPALAGGMLETGIGRAALLALAAQPGFAETGDISASARYFGPGGDLTEDHVLTDGSLRVPDGPGLGVAIRPEQLARYTVAREWCRAGER